MIKSEIIKALKGGVKVAGGSDCSFSIENITDGLEMSLEILAFMSDDKTTEQRFAYLDEWLEEKLDQLADDVLQSWE